MATGTQTRQNLIGGEWVDASGETFESRSPANGDLIGTFPRSSADDVDRAVAAAKEAYESWRLVPAPKRGEILFRFGALLAEHKDELTELMSREMGKVLAEAGGDVQEAVDMSYYMAGEGRRLFGHTTPSELPDKFQMSVRQPIGVVGVITPWNFPIAIPSWKIVPALVCGNTVVFKPANDTPMLGQRFVELLVEAGVPDGVVNLVHGFGREVGDRIVRHPDVRVVTLTGSRETGVAVLEAAAEGLKHVHLELGGKNGIIVMDDADLDLAVDGIVWSAFGTSGQRCTAASRVIVHRSVYDELRSRLVAAVERLRLGPGWEAETDVGPVINAAALEKIHSYTEIGQDEGATLLTGGEIADDNGLDGRLLLPADDLRGRRGRHADRPGGDLRPDDGAHSRRRLRRGDPRRQRHPLRALVVDLHGGREPRLPRHARSRGRHHVRQRRHHRRRGAPAVRRHEGHGQRPPRGRAGRARRLHRVEVDLRRLLGEAPARPDRHRASLRARLFTDGGSRGNPGPAAYGYVLEAEDGTVLAAHGEAIGVATNNVAEYRALLAGLERAADAGIDELAVVSDSELLVKQMRGEYKVKNAALRELWEEAQHSARRLSCASPTRPCGVRRTSSPIAL